MGGQIYVADMADDDTRALQEEMMAAKDRHRKLETDWQRRVDAQKEQNHRD